MLIHDIAVVASKDAVGLFAYADGRRELKVPVGMEGMDAAKALAVLYKTFVVFRRTMRKRDRLAALDGAESQAPEGLEAADDDDAYTFHDAHALDELFERIDPTRLLALRDGRGRNAADVHKRIDRHLHLALFDGAGVPFLERVPGARRELRYGESDIVGLYCFLASDFYRRFLHVDVATAWGRFASEGVALAADFQQRHLHTSASLYDGNREACLHTLHCLRHVLRTIDRSTPFRHPEYRMLHDALDRYLHGGAGVQGAEGLVWGLRDFWAVWESACLLYAAKDDFEHFLTCDFEHMPVTLADADRRRRWLKQRQVLFARNEIARRPDLVIESGAGTTIIDFKFYAAAPSSRPKRDQGAIDKLERDFLSIEAYGLLLQNHMLRTSPERAPTVSLEFWLPGQKHSRTPWPHTPNWDPPLSIVTLPTAELLDTYGLLYEFS